MKRIASTTATLALLLALPACGDDKEGTDTASETASPMTDGTGDKTTSGDPSSSGDASSSGEDPTSTGEPTTGEPQDLSFAADVYGPILSVSCSCHMPGPSGMLAMGADAASAYAALIDKPSTPGMPFVTPGNSEESYMFHKVNNTHVEAGGGGQRMPLGGMLTPAQIATIKAWIDGGAAQ